MSLLRASLAQGLGRRSFAKSELVLARLLSTEPQAGVPAASAEGQPVREEAGEEAEAGAEAGAEPAKRLALPFKYRLSDGSNYPQYLQQRWRYQPTGDAAKDKYLMHRLANICEFQHIMGLKMGGLMQTIITDAVKEKEAHRHAGAPSAVINAYEESIKRLIGLIVWFKRNHNRPTTDALAQFREERVQRIKKVVAQRRAARRAAKQAQQQQLEEEEGSSSSSGSDSDSSSSSDGEEQGRRQQEQEQKRG